MTFSLPLLYVWDLGITALVNQLSIHFTTHLINNLRGTYVGGDFLNILAAAWSLFHDSECLFKHPLAQGFLPFFIITTSPMTFSLLLNANKFEVLGTILTLKNYFFKERSWPVNFNVGRPFQNGSIQSSLIQ